MNKEIEKLKKELYDLRILLQKYDCRFTNSSIADFSGSHCPFDDPCQRCQLEKLERKYGEHNG